MILGEAKAIISHPSDLSAAALLLHHQDAVKKEEEEALEDLKKVLKEKHREAYTWYFQVFGMIFEWNKTEFTRTMEKARLTNEIIMERFRTEYEDPELSALTRKASQFIKQINSALSLGLDGYMFGCSKKRKAASSLQKKEEEDSHDEEDLEELRDLKSLHEEGVLQMVESDREEVRELCNIIYRCARPFAKLEAREKYLSSLVESLLEREREREEGKLVVPTSQIEILGYMLLEETVTSTLKHRYFNFTPDSPPVPVIPKLAESRNSMTLASIREEPAQKIQVTIDHPSLYNASGKFSFEIMLAADYRNWLTKAKSVCNSEMEQVKWILSQAEGHIEKYKKVCQEFPKVLSEQASLRSFESQLAKFCEDLSDMRYGRCLHAFSEVEIKKFGEIGDLAHKVIEKYRKEKGPESVPVVSEPILPSFTTRT